MVCGWHKYMTQRVEDLAETDLSTQMVEEFLKERYQEEENRLNRG